MGSPERWRSRNSWIVMRSGTAVSSVGAGRTAAGNGCGVGCAAVSASDGRDASVAGAWAGEAVAARDGDVTGEAGIDRAAGAVDPAGVTPPCRCRYRAIPPPWITTDSSTTRQVMVN